MSELLPRVCCPHFITKNPEKHLHIHLRPIRKLTVTISQLRADRQKLPPVSQWLSNCVGSERYPELGSKQPLLGWGTESSHLPLPSLILKVPVHTPRQNGPLLLWTLSHFAYCFLPFSSRSRQNMPCSRVPLWMCSLSLTRASRSSGSSSVPIRRSWGTTWSDLLRWEIAVQLTF